MAKKAAKKADFKGAISGIIEEKEEPVVVEQDNEIDSEQVTSDEPFILEKKKKKKAIKKSFPLYMEEEKVNELDKICNKTGYTRNELINLMISYALKNLEIK